MKNKYSDLRVSYQQKYLDESNIEKNPFKLFEQWFNIALKSGILEPNAMTLATADNLGKPSARIVLLKDLTQRGFVFFTNYKSRKGDQLNENPFAALVFWWDKLERQIRIEGKVEKLSKKDSDIYFNSRPRGSQLGAVISRQSEVIPNYNFLKNEFLEFKKGIKGKKIIRPNYWGGYLLKPELIEFWQGRENRLHDRIRYTKKKSKSWLIERLSP